MANKANKSEDRITIRNQGLKAELMKEVVVDPRFDSLTGYATHLIEVGRQADAENREAAISEALPRKAGKKRTIQRKG